MCRRAGPLVAAVRTRGFKTVRAIVDSGAESSVTPPGIFDSPVVDTVMSKNGITYNGADGSPIKALGATEIRFEDATGRKAGIQMEVAEITDPLISVARLCDAGFRVVFDKEGGRIRHVKTGREIPLPRVGNCYVMDMHVPAKSEEEERKQENSEGMSASAFQRPE